MKTVTKLLIDQFEMTDMDWMGYSLEPKEIFSYHHLIVPKRDGGRMTMDNGAILIQSASHDYLHRIENYDNDIFNYLTQILIEVNRQRTMPTNQQLKDIDLALRDFEKRWLGKYTSHGKPVIKQRYLRRL